MAEPRCGARVSVQPEPAFKPIDAGPGYASAGRVRSPASCAKTSRNSQIEHKSPGMAPALTIETLPGTADIATAMAAIGRDAKAAARVLAIAPAV